jgi:16S rRNA (uracil1498-N3)-methyltransferase
VHQHTHNLFYIKPENVLTHEIIVTGAEVQHLTRVLRKQVDDIIVATDGKGNRYTAQIYKVTHRLVKAIIVKKDSINVENTFNATLAFVPLKGTRNEFVIEKGTELGVKTFLLFLSRFSVLSTVSHAKLERYKNVAVSATLQSQQYYIPDIMFLNDMSRLTKTFADYDLVLLADRRGEPDLSSPAEKILFIVGPEGGFDTAEIELCTQHGAHLLSLGTHRLRSETAAVCGIAKILTAYKKL